LNPVLSISSPGFQKSSPGFVKHESGFSSSPGPGFSRVRIFFESESGSESESGPGFEVCRFNYDISTIWIDIKRHKTAHAYARAPIIQYFTAWPTFKAPLKI
jgi:hypothetical protein